MDKFRSINDVWEYLDNIPMFSKVGASASNFGLENIQLFCSKIGNPQDEIKTIHVAGTNGKGTVTLLLESIYRKAGYKTGAFTSPHLLKYNERVKISGQDISDEKLLEFFQSNKSVLEEFPLTYFEISTVLAFWAFADSKVDIAIIEAGLGGRLDSTNIITPECSIITSIGLDHQVILGDTKPEIAREKAGIIKKRVPVVIGNIEGEELKELLKKAQSEEARVCQSREMNPTFKNGEVTLRTIEKPIKTNFIEPVNASNIATAVSVVDTLMHLFPVDETVKIMALESFEGVSARFERLNRNMNWYFSGAHNPEAITSLIESLSRFEGANIHLILSMMKDKMSKDTLAPFKRFENIYFYQQDVERGGKMEEIQKYLSVESINDSNFEIILDELKHEVVIFAGSFYFYPIVKRWLTHLN